MDERRAATALPKKRVRKPRGRGLRTKTGCLTCRERHKKCDEKQPVCGPCSISSRQCVFPHSQGVGRRPSPVVSNTEPMATRPRDDEDQSRVDEQLSQSIGSVGSIDLDLQPSAPPVTQSPGDYGLALGDVYSYSPETVASELWTTDLASTRWLGLLATDAAEADSGFSLAPSPAPEGDEQRRATTQHGPPDATNLESRLNNVSDPERKTWQTDKGIVLSSQEAVLFRHFTERSARWLDLLDHQKLFSTYAVRLALRNAGLMNAILALSAKHLSKLEGRHQEFETGIACANRNSGGEWVRYYYETLRYVQEALAYTSYTASEELNATAIVISAYEMLDESDGRGNWQRHLKGVFWIQRSQDVNGASGGLRQAVWWAWLRQDIWAAFREKRRCLSFWAADKEFHELDQHGLADRAIYLLSRAVNYCAYSRMMEVSSDISASDDRARAGLEMLAEMERWKLFLGDEFKPLPSPTTPSDVFTPLWVHPPQFGVALQAYSFAKILVLLHKPVSSGFDGYLKMQRSISEAVDTICGIAMELTDEGCQILSAQCLYGAGLCVQDPLKREKILSLMEKSEERVGWTPMATWRNDLRQAWTNADGQSPDTMR
ncbi:Zn(II)2Cys6 transcription factor [Colletotrichum tofieldiae]|uniref:Zn(II)2Cys6 transcription factor n=1 Tax=Colletotrichum tofieldiae TaxID=708197 RepID=A0A161YJ62_9PEZI|nr:Zn(II)2Cys6 transcription factor [Colletotrichum tofieldiae]